jgi:hypothetical protein
LQSEEKIMRSNSGNGKSVNNNHDVTMRDHERAKGVSGTAIHGEKRSATGADRKSARKTGSGTSG